MNSTRSPSALDDIGFGRGAGESVPWDAPATPVADSVFASDGSGPRHPTAAGASSNWENAFRTPSANAPVGQRLWDTPRGGDFIRYVDGLQSASAARAAQQVPPQLVELDGRPAAGDRAATPRHRTTATGAPGADAAAGASPFGLGAVWSLARVLLLAWVALQLLIIAVPAAAVLTTFAIPLLAVLAVGWLLLRARAGLSGGAAGERLRAMRSQLAQELRQRQGGVRNP